MTDGDLDRMEADAKRLVEARENLDWRSPMDGGKAHAFIMACVGTTTGTDVLALAAEVRWLRAVNAALLAACEEGLRTLDEELSVLREGDAPAVERCRESLKGAIELATRKKP